MMAEPAQDNLVIGNTKEYTTVVIRADGVDPNFQMKSLRVVNLLTFTFLTVNFNKYKILEGQTQNINKAISDLELLGIDLIFEGGKINLEKFKELVTEKCKGYDIKKELKLSQKYLGKALNLVFESNEPVIYSIPPQSVIKIGESKFQFQHSTQQITQYPVLIADMSDATNYYLLKECGEELTKITSSVLGEGSFSVLARLLSMNGHDFVSSRDLMKLGIKEGNNLTCDLLVSDIYGESASAINLPGEIIASVFGKPDHTFSSREDKLKSLIILHCMDIANVTGLLVKIHKAKNALFLMPNLEGQTRGAAIESYLSTCLDFYWAENKPEQILFFGSEEKNDNKIEAKYLSSIGQLI